MNATQLGMFVGSFFTSLLLAVVWLLICKAISPLRRRPGISYGVAIVLGFVPSVITIGGPSVSNVLAALLCGGLLFWQYNRAKANCGSQSPAMANLVPNSTLQPTCPPSACIPSMCCARIGAAELDH